MLAEAVARTSQCSSRMSVCNWDRQESVIFVDNPSILFSCCIHPHPSIHPPTHTHPHTHKHPHTPTHTPSFLPSLLHPSKRGGAMTRKRRQPFRLGLLGTWARITLPTYGFRFRFCLFDQTSFPGKDQVSQSVSPHPDLTKTPGRSICWNWPSLSFASSQKCPFKKCSLGDIPRTIFFSFSFHAVGRPVPRVHTVLHSSRRFEET